MNEKELVIQMPFGRVCELIEKAERIAAVERYLNGGSYLTVREIISLLGINVKEEKTNEAV